MNLSQIIHKWFCKTVNNQSPSVDPILEELKEEYRRVLKEMKIYAEGRGAENIPIDESCKITFDLIRKSENDRLSK